jgi:hypothetical protein
MRFFNAALMLASQRIHTGAARYAMTELHNGFGSTFGRFEVGPLTKEKVK